MIVFFSVGSIIFVVVFIILIICGMVDSSMQIYEVLYSHMGTVIFVLILRAIISVAITAFLIKIRNKKSHFSEEKLFSKRLISGIISHIAFIICCIFFITNMKEFYIEHPIATGLCSIGVIGFFAIEFIFGTIRTLVFDETEDDENCFLNILTIVISVLIMISCFVTGVNAKVILDLLFGGIYVLFFCDFNE